jgi:ABC-type multidrug transport system ATPase subunit
MTISLSDAGKRFNREWIFRHFSYTFLSGNSYAITGPNGSGKSTLLQAICGALMLSEGTLQYRKADKPVPEEYTYRQVSICAPYLEVIEEMTVTELLRFHQQFKPFLPGLDTQKIITLLGLEQAADKQIRFYSSGMKQRVKLAQAIFSDTPVLLLDEPCTNLDTTGYVLYHQLINDYGKDRLVIVSSNDPQEYDFCGEVLRITDYK